MKHLILFENFEDKSIDDVIDFIQPSNPMDSEEYTYYCFGDDEAYYGPSRSHCGVTLDDYMSAIEGSVFREDSNTSKKFGWDFLQTNKQEILDRCIDDLLSSDIEFENNDGNQEEEFGDDDYDDDVVNFVDDDSNIDLAIELENKLRTLSDDSKLTIDDFLEEFGVSPEHMTGFAWASILKNAEQYKKMSDEEFNKLYDEYKNSVNESLITEKNVAINSELWNQCKAWAKAKYDVWPSAYACGAAAKRYKSKGGKWKKKKSKKK